MGAALQCLALAAPALAIVPIAAAAQTSAVHAGPTVEANFGLASGALGAHATGGIGGLLGFEILSNDAPVGLRLEGLYQKFWTRNPVSVCEVGQACSGGPHAFGFGADVLLADKGGRSSARYLIAGAGGYKTRELAVLPIPGGLRTGFMNASGLGWNVGVGLRVPRIGTGWHTEFRYFGLPVASGSGGVLLLTLGFQS